MSSVSAFLILGAMEKIEKQIEEIKKELEDNPGDTTLLNELGVGYHILGEYDQAVQTYQKVLKNEPSNYQVHYNLANTFFELEKIEKAVNHYLDALDHKPDFVPALNNLADIYELADEQKRARELFEYITKIRPSDPMGFFNLGNHHLRNNNTVEAGRCYKKTLELDSEFHEAYNNIGLILKHVGKFEEAIGYYEKCLEIEPEYQPAINDLEEIRKESCPPSDR